MIKFLKRTAATLILTALAACGPQVTTGINVDHFGTLMNKERARKNLAPLAVAPELNVAANVHANDMAATNNFSHTSRSGGTPSDRVHAQDYNFCFIAENIARGHPSEELALEAWMKSPGHRENILSRSVTEFGVARSTGDYWVLVLARPC